MNSPSAKSLNMQDFLRFQPLNAISRKSLEKVRQNIKKELFVELKLLVNIGKNALPDTINLQKGLKN